MVHWINGDGVGVVSGIKTCDNLARRCVNHGEERRAWRRGTAGPTDCGQPTRREPAVGKVVAIGRRIIGDLVTAARIERCTNGSVCTVEDYEGKRRAGR